MTAKAQGKTPAKTPAAAAAARIPQPTAAVPELEAERPDIAAQLDGAARLGHRLGAVGVASPGPPIIQRQELPEEEEEELQLKREPAAVQRQERPDEEEELMLKPEGRRAGPQGGQVPPQVEAAIGRARGGGQPLERALPEQMSASLGHDFSRVRVHTDSEADQLNQQLQAKAFTTGPDIFFKRGAYAPGSGSGQELIAHELTHVVQQSSGRVGGSGRGMTVRPAGDTLEQEADAQGQQMAIVRAMARPDLDRPAAISARQGTGRKGNARSHWQRQGTKVGEKDSDGLDSMPQNTGGGMRPIQRSITVEGIRYDEWGAFQDRYGEELSDGWERWQPHFDRLQEVIANKNFDFKADNLDAIASQIGAWHHQVVRAEQKAAEEVREKQRRRGRVVAASTIRANDYGQDTAISRVIGLRQGPVPAEVGAMLSRLAEGTTMGLRPGTPGPTRGERRATRIEKAERVSSGSVGRDITYTLPGPLETLLVGLFDTIALATGVRLTPLDLFHGHMFQHAVGEGGIGIIFHAKEMPRELGAEVPNVAEAKQLVLATSNTAKKIRQHLRAQNKGEAEIEHEMERLVEKMRPKLVQDVNRQDRNFLWTSGGNYVSLLSPQAQGAKTLATFRDILDPEHYSGALGVAVATVSQELFGETLTTVNYFPGVTSAFFRGFKGT